MNSQSTPFTTARPSWMLTISFWMALVALFFTSKMPIVLGIGIVALWPHFVPARMPRNSSATWIIRLLIYGGVFAFFGTKPVMGADWIFDAKTFNMIGLIAAGEAALELWREPPEGARYYTIVVFCTCVVLMAACNTFNPRFILIFAPLYLLFTLLALREWRIDPEVVVGSTPSPTLPHGRGALALMLALALGAAMHVTVLQNRHDIMRWGFQLLRDRDFYRGAGISNQPDLGPTFNLRGGTQRLMRIEGSLNDGHLRAAAFNSYSGGRWWPPLSDRKKDAFPDLAPPQNSHNQNNKTFRARITKLGEMDKLIFAPLNAVTLTPAEGSSFDWDQAIGPIICEDPAPYSYDVFWNTKGADLGVPLHQGVLCVPLKAKMRKPLLQLPLEIDPRVKTLALELTATAVDAPEKVEAIGEYLLKNHKYSLRASPGQGDPVSNFLLQKKSAHCEYFASAAVVLMRAAGVPSRYVTGYMAHEPYENGTVVRQRDAHAWAEAWIDGVGWVTVDATPADGTPEANPPASAWQRAWEKIQDETARLRERVTALSPTQIFILILLIVAVWLVERARVRRKKKSQQTPDFQYSAPADLAALASRFETILRTANGEISPAKPLTEYARDQYAREFLTTYNRARFGGGATEGVLRELTNQIEHLEKTIKKGNAHDAHTDAAPTR